MMLYRSPKTEEIRVKSHNQGRIDGKHRSTLQLVWERTSNELRGTQNLCPAVGIDELNRQRMRPKCVRDHCAFSTDK